MTVQVNGTFATPCSLCWTPHSHLALTPNWHTYMPWALIWASSLNLTCRQSPLPASVNPYNRIVVGRAVRNTQSPRFCVMWTMTSVPQRLADFRPNHFVYLSRPSSQSVDTDIEDEGDETTAPAQQPTENEDEPDNSNRWIVCCTMYCNRANRICERGMKDGWETIRSLQPVSRRVCHKRKKMWPRVLRRTIS